MSTPSVLLLIKLSSLLMNTLIGIGINWALKMFTLKRKIYRVQITVLGKRRISTTGLVVYLDIKRIINILKDQTWKAKK